MINQGVIVAGDQPLHVAVNWNSLCGFLESTGRNTMSSLAEIGSLTPKELPALVASCVNEGERLRGQEDFGMTAEKISETFGVEEMNEFLGIFSASTATDTSKKKE